MNLLHISAWQIELLPWYAFLVVWAVAALWAKSVKVAEPASARLLYTMVMGTGFFLLFSRRADVWVLKQRFITDAPWVGTAGIVLTFAGAALAIWARIILGENWSAKVTRKVGHELVRSGPYRVVRHPIYSGLLLAVIGTALVVGEWRGVLAIPFVLGSESLKARREEEFMLAEFGDAYRQYRGETGFLIPGW
jgi:protein-S-isoprenylcysteine O-methyltransferase Ste14